MTDNVISRNPTTGDILASYPLQSAAELEAALQQSADAYAEWRYTSMPQRVRVLHQLAEQIRQRQDELATMATLEMGKPIAQARAEVLKCANLCDWYAERSDDPCRQTNIGGKPASVAVISPDWCDSCCNAMELPLLAGSARRSQHIAGRQYLRAQARAERNGIRQPDEVTF